MKKTIIFICLILIMAGCQKKVENERALYFPYTAWENDALCGVLFLGYGDYNDFDHYHSSDEFQLYMNLYPSISNITKVQTNLGDQIYLVLSRFENTHITITTQDQVELLDEANFDSVLMRINPSETMPEVTIKLRHNHQIIEFNPLVTLMDNTLPSYARVMDLSLYPQSPSSFNGQWHHEDFDLIVNDVLSLVSLKDNTTFMGSLYFDVPIDFKEDFDVNENIIYVDLLGESDRFQLFGKFLYHFEDDDTLILKHLSYDPLFKGEENAHYTLKRKAVE